jgi:hypothetical protein
MLTPEQLQQINASYRQAVALVNSGGEVYWDCETNKDAVCKYLHSENVAPENWGNELIFSQAILYCRAQGLVTPRPAQPTEQELAREREKRDRADGRQYKVTESSNLKEQFNAKVQRDRELVQAADKRLNDAQKASNDMSIPGAEATSVELVKLANGPNGTERLKKWMRTYQRTIVNTAS